MDHEHTIAAIRRLNFNRKVRKRAEAQRKIKSIIAHSVAGAQLTDSRFELPAEVKGADWSAVDVLYHRGLGHSQTKWVASSIVSIDFSAV